MGLSGALTTAFAGLNATQQSVDLVARNISNVGTPGYTKKSLEQIAAVVGGQSVGVRSGAITRSLNDNILAELRTQLSQSGRLDTVANTLSRLDSLFGVPGGAGAVDTILNDFVASLQDLSDNPESAAARSIVITQAEAIASELHNLSAGVQGLRQEAENGIGEAVERANFLGEQLASINGEIALAQGGTGSAVVELLDHRDVLLAEYATLLDIRVHEADDGQVRVTTKAGHSLVDGRRHSTLVFDANASVNPGRVYDPDPSVSQVGMLYIDNGSGQQLDIYRDGGVTGGAIAGYLELRDDILVTAQSQFDELAHALATALSERQIAGTAVTVGPQDGFDIDLAALQSGDEFTLSYTETPPGETRVVTIVRVDDPATLPLANDVTARSDDTVIGIDFSGGIAAAAAALDAALGSAFTVSNPTGSTLQILDDGAAGTIDITDLSASVTTTGTVDQGLGLALFVDGEAGLDYTGALDGQAQKIGFSSRIAVNSLVTADDTTLVVHSTSPATQLGDQERPRELLARVTQNKFTFSPHAGLGSTGSPINETIDAYTRRVIIAQTGAAAVAESQRSIQRVVTNTFEERVQQDSGVDIDQELTRLIALEQAYSANARVISVVNDLMDLLARI